MANRTKRKSYSAEEKFNIVLELLGGKGPSELGEEHGINANQISRWKKEFINNGHIVFSRNREPEAIENDCGQVCEQLYGRIGKQQVEIEYLKEELAALQL